MQHQELQKCRTEHHTTGDRERISKLQRVPPRTGRDEGHEQPTVTGRGCCDRQAGQRRAATGGSASGDEAEAEVEVAATAAADGARAAADGADGGRRQGAATRRATGEAATGGEG